MSRLPSYPIIFILPLTLFFFSSCGLGVNSIDLPLDRPSSTISGSAAGGFLKNADIQVYALDKTLSEHLGSGVVNEQGEIVLELTAQNQFILIQASGGIYIEPSSGKEITLFESNVITTVAKYQSGEPLQIELTPFTHLATSLIRYHLLQDMPIEAAQQNATKLFAHWLGFDVFQDSAQPFVLDADENINLDANTDEQYPPMISENLSYRLYLYALSELSTWLARKNGHDNPDVYNTLSVLQVMNQDIFADGLLNGFGLNDENEIMPLALGQVVLTPDTYRMGFAQQLVIGIEDQVEFAGVEVQPIVDIAKQLALKPIPLLSDEEAKTDLLEFSPKFKHRFTQANDKDNIFNIVVDAEAASIIESVFFNVDGNDIPGDNLLVFDPSQYESGEISLLINVVDIFGNQSQQQILIDFEKILTRFNNTYLEITSPVISNQTDYQIEGIFYGQNITSITISGIEMAIDTDKIDTGNWRGLLSLLAGRNVLDITLNYDDEFQEYLTAEIIVDQIPPVVLTDNLHGDARFSQIDIKPLEDANENPIIIESDKLNLNGTLINRTSLSENTFPYFAFILSDEGDLRDISNAAYEVQYKYFKDDQQQGEARTLLPLDDEYIIPLVKETLHPEWYKTNRDQTHTIRLEVKDEAGNLVLKDFTFKADIRVPTLNLDYAANLATNIFDTTDFENRDILNNIEIESMKYSFTNNTDSQLHLQLEDTNEHIATQIVDKMIRENINTKKTIAEWRIKSNFNIASIWGECPTKAAEDYLNITSIWKYVGPGEQDWVEKLVPDVISEQIKVDSDDSMNNTNTSWEDASIGFDPLHRLHVQQKFDGDGNVIEQLQYEYDFLKTENHQNFPSYIKSWQSYKINPIDGSIFDQVVCTETNFADFQKRQLFEYFPVEGYPKNTPSTTTNTKAFYTSSFSILDNDTNTNIEEKNGWYSIPIGHRVTLAKKVTTPLLDVYSDTEVIEQDFLSYIEKKYDKSISWKIGSTLKMTTAVDAGPENIGLMSEHVQSITRDDVIYEISRDD